MNQIEEKVEIFYRKVEKVERYYIMLNVCILGKQSWSLCVMDVGDSPLNDKNKEDTTQKYKYKNLIQKNSIWQYNKEDTNTNTKTNTNIEKIASCHNFMAIY